MAFWNWEPGLNTGIDVIDAQHQRIVDYVNQLDEIGVENTDRAKLGEILDSLIDYTYSHFAFEEGLMEQANYKYLKAHIKIHDSFRQRVEGLRHRFELGEDVSLILKSELKIWLVNHIKVDDKFYVPSVENNVNPGWIAKTLKLIFG